MVASVTSDETATAQWSRYTKKIPLVKEKYCTNTVAGLVMMKTVIETQWEDGANDCDYDCHQNFRCEVIACDCHSVEVCSTLFDV